MDSRLSDVFVISPAFFSNDRGRNMELLEREPLFNEMEAILGDVAGGGGRVTFVSGEAGIGKTSLVEQFTERRPPIIRFAPCSATFRSEPSAGCAFARSRKTRST